MLGDWVEGAKREGTYRYTLEQDAVGSGAPAGFGSLFNLEGAVDTDKGLSRTVTTINVLGFRSTCTFLMKDEKTVYASVHPSKRAQVGASWLSSEAESALTASSLFIRPDQLDDDPERYFGDLSRDGTENIDGVRTTRYRGSLDLASVYAEATPPPNVEGFGAEIPVALYLDDDGLLRRMRLELSSTEDVSVSFTIDLFDYGEPVDIDLPAAGAVKEGRPEEIATACYPSSVPTPSPSP